MGETKYGVPSIPLVPVDFVEVFTTKNHPIGTYSYRFTCIHGHWHRRKGSQGVPGRVRCRECYYSQPESEGESECGTCGGSGAGKHDIHPLDYSQVEPECPDCQEGE